MLRSKKGDHAPKLSTNVFMSPLIPKTCLTISKLETLVRIMYEDDCYYRDAFSKVDKEAGKGSGVRVRRKRPM